MDYEKAYKAALEIARKINNGDGVATPADWTVCETIFPVLREDYDDMIRGAIIDHLKDYNLTEWADWLEKQGEQKSIDNKEKLDVLKFIRKETCCGLVEANNALLKLIKVLKERPLPIMDKPCKLKIEWEEQK